MAIPPILKNTFGCVMVTYGSRSDFVIRCIEPLMKCAHISKIVLVNNGSLTDYELLISDRKVSHINVSENAGSAKGFALGIKKARELKLDYIMLLDDDNLIDIKSLSNLVEWVQHTNVDCCAALRTDRPEFIEVSKGASHKNISTNSYLDYSLFNPDVVSKYLEEFRFGYPLINYYTYSGLVFKSCLLEHVKYPNQDYFLYCDDYDFTYRISKYSNGIVLKYDVEIDDIDKSWVAKTNDGHQYFVSKEDQMRLYYSIRNRAFFEKENFVNNKLIYCTNFLTLIMKLAVIATVRSKDKVNSYSCIRLLLKATFNGWKGKLGKCQSHL